MVLEKLDIYTLFNFRYLVDIQNDIVNLEHDVNDLLSFPERLKESYKAEWISYIKRQLASDKQLKHKLATFDESQWSEFESVRYKQMLKIVKHADKISNTHNITVIHSPLKTYVNRLLKL